MPWLVMEQLRVVPGDLDSVLGSYSQPGALFLHVGFSWVEGGLRASLPPLPSPHTPPPTPIPTHGRTLHPRPGLGYRCEPGGIRNFQLHVGLHSLPLLLTFALWACASPFRAVLAPGGSLSQDFSPAWVVTGHLSPTPQALRRVLLPPICPGLLPSPFSTQRLSLLRDGENNEAVRGTRSHFWFLGEMLEREKR